MAITGFHVHDVIAVELAGTYLSNGNSRTIRITTRDFQAHEATLEITLFGATEAVDALPRAADFYEHREPAAA